MQLVPFNKNNFDNKNPAPILAGESLTTIQEGTFTFKNLIIYGMFSTSYVLLMKPIIIGGNSLPIDYKLKNELIFNGSYGYYFPITISNCFYGQTIKVSSDNPNLSYCESCSPGTFSIVPSLSCASCPLGANCNEGILDVNPGYWRISANVYACPRSSSCM